MTARTLTEPEVMEAADSEIAQLRVPPHSIEAESSVLGGLLLDNGAWDRIGDILTEADFYRREHRLIFTSMAQLINANKAADVVTVYSHLQGTGNAAEIGGLGYLNSLAQYMPSAGNIRRYAEIVRERSVLRKLVAASDEIAAAAFNPDGKPVVNILDEAEQKIFQIGQSAKTRAVDEWQSADDGITEVLDHIQKRSDGHEDFLPTGITALDNKLDGGMREGEVIVIAGRPGMGKTSLALSIGEHVADKHDAPVGVMSMEMPKLQVNNRRASMHSKVPLHKIRRPERMSDNDWSQFTAAIERMRRLPVHVTDQSAMNINQVRAKARALKRKSGLRVLVIDYIGLMDGTDRKANRATQLGEVSRGIKALAKELGITVLLLAQLNREVEKRTNNRPILADLRECGDIEQDADVILFVHRPIVAKPDLMPEWKYYAEIIIAKQRDGETADVIAQYIGERTQFSDWPAEVEIPSSKVIVKGGGKAL
jgi:replicative DNA helicase